MKPDTHPGPSPGILDRHIKTTMNFDGMVAHKLYGVMGPVNWIHTKDRIPSCKFCRALGIVEIKDHGG